MNFKVLENLKLEIANIQKKIEKTEEKQNEYQQDLKNAILTGKPEFIQTNIKALLDSATQELIRLGQEKGKLMDKETALERPISIPEKNSARIRSRDIRGCVLTGRETYESDVCHIVPWIYFQKHDLMGRKIFDSVFPYSCDNPDHRVMDVRNGILMWTALHSPFDRFDFTIIKDADCIYKVKTLAENEFEEARDDADKKLQKEIIALNGKRISFNSEKQNEWPGEKFLKFHNECFALKREERLKAEAEAQDSDYDFDPGIAEEYYSL